MAFLDTEVIIQSGAQYPIVAALPDPAELNDAVAPDPVLGDCEYAIFPAVFDAREHNNGIAAEDLDPGDALLDLAPLNLGLIPLVHPDPDAPDVLELVPEQHLLGPGSPAVHAGYGPVLDLAILHQKFTALDAPRRVLRLTH